MKALLHVMLPEDQKNQERHERIKKLSKEEIDEVLKREDESVRSSRAAGLMQGFIKKG